MGVFLEIISNPPMAAIISGILFSLVIRWGGRETRFPFWLDTWLTNFGSTVTPVAAFTIGMFLAGRETDFLRSWAAGVTVLVIKLLLMPLVALGLARGFHFDGIKGRAAVLIAALPVAVAAFSLAQKYFVGVEQERAKALITGQVVFGSILMAPVFVAWNKALDDYAVFGDVAGKLFTG